MECLEDLEEHLDLTLNRSVSGLRVVLLPVSEPTVMEELVEERVVLEPHQGSRLLCTEAALTLTPLVILTLWGDAFSVVTEEGSAW